MPTRRRTASPQQLVPIEVADLSGGWDLRHSPSRTPANRARILRNWSIAEEGALAVYPGFLTFSTASLGAARNQGGDRIYLKNIAPFTLGAHAGSIYKPSDAGVWGSAVLTGRSAVNEIYFPHDQDMVAVFDAATAPQKSTDGTTWTKMGVDTPGAAPTLALIAGGSLTVSNTYGVTYSYRDDGLLHEGNESAEATIATTAGNLTVRATIPRSTDPQVETIVVYARNSTAGETVRRRTGTVANPGAGDATFDITSENWSANNEAPTDHTVPPVTLAFGLKWKNRWWARDNVTKTRVWFTQIFQGQSWPALFFLDLPFPEGDEILAFSASGDVLTVWGYNRPFHIIGQTSLDFEVRPASGAEAGALGPRAVEVIEHGTLHAAADGLYIYDGATDRLLSHDIETAWRDVMENAAAADIDRIDTVYHRERKEVRVAVPRLYPTGAAGELILDLTRTRTQQTPAWTSTTRAVGGYIHWRGKEPTAANRGRLFSWMTTDGKMMEEAVGTTADGADMIAEYEGPVLPLGYLVHRLLELYGDCEPVDGLFSIEPFVDGKSLGGQSVPIAAGGPILGVAIVGTATLGGASRKMFTLGLPLSAEGRTFQAALKYTGRATFRMFTYGSSAVPEPAPRAIGVS